MVFLGGEKTLDEEKVSCFLMIGKRVERTKEKKANFLLKTDTHSPFIPPTW